MRATVLLPFLLACGGAAQAAPRATTTSGEPGTIVVLARGFRNDHGRALFALYASSKGFPGEPTHALRKVEARIVKGRARVLLTRVPPGDYAVALLHDEDGDRKMKTGLLGIPKEGYAASNNARSRFGPPEWDDARFPLEPGTSVTQTLDVIYH